MQARNEAFAKMGMLESFMDIFKKEGLKGLWRVSYLVIKHGIAMFLLLIFVRGWSCNDEELVVVAGHRGQSPCMTTHAQISTKHAKPCLITVIVTLLPSLQTHIH